MQRHVRVGGIVVLVEDVCGQVFGGLFNAGRLLETRAGGRDHAS